jgi:hypothetical protein
MLPRVRIVGRLAVPVGLVRWRDDPTSYSPVVKITYDLGSSGWASMAREQVPLTTGDEESGRVLRPSDFAEAKGACEVAVVGRSLVEPTGLVRLRVGGHVLEAPRGALLGAKRVGGGRDYFSDPDHRVPFPSLPLEVVVEGFGETLRSAIAAPSAELGVAIGEGLDDYQPVQLFVDAILVEPRKRRLSLVYRGLFSHHGDVEREVRLLVDPLGRLDAASVPELSSWPQLTGPVVSPTAREDADVDHGVDTVPRRPAPRTVPPSPPRGASPGFDADSTVSMQGAPAGPPMRSTAAMPSAPPAPVGAMRSTAAMPSAPPAPVGAMRSTAAMPGAPIVAPTVVAPSGPSGDALPFARTPARSAAPARHVAPPSPLPSGTLPTPPVDPRATLPFVPTPAAAEPVDGDSTAEVPRPREIERAISRPAEERTALVDLRALEAQRAAALPFAKQDGELPPRPLPVERRAPSEGPDRGTRVDPEELLAPPPALPFVDGPRDTLPPTAASDDGPVTLPPPPRRGGFDADEHTAQIPIGSLRSALPFDPHRPAALPAPRVAAVDEEGVRRGDTEPPVAAAPEIATGVYGEPLPPPPAFALSLTAMRVDAPPVEPRAQTPVFRVQEVERPVPVTLATDKIPDLSLDDYAALRAALWTGERPRREILRERGLSELRWRAIERKWAAQIEAAAADPQKLLPLLSRLQSAAAQRA